MGYHNYATAKYEALGYKYDMCDVMPVSKEKVKSLALKFKELGVLNTVVD